MYVSTLHDFVKALGGELKITAKFPEGTVEITQRLILRAPQVRVCGVVPHRIPTDERHSPAHGGTGANMALLAPTSPYAGSVRLTILELPAARWGTDLLKSGSSWWIALAFG